MERGPMQRVLCSLSLCDRGICDVSDENVFSLTKLAQDGDIDMVLHAGDISYANGYQATWDGYFRKMEMIMAYVPYMVRAR